MQCDKFEQRLNELLDERVDPALDEQIQAHLSLCPACRETWAAYEQLLLGVDLQPEPSGQFTANIMAQLAPMQGAADSPDLAFSDTAPASTLSSTKPNRSGLVVVLAVGSIALLLLVALAPLAWQRIFDEQGGSPLAEVEWNVPAENGVPANDQRPEQTVPAPADSEDQLAQSSPSDSAPDVADTAAQEGDFHFDAALSRARLTLALRDLAVRSTEEAAERLDSVESIARPITSSFSIAIGALRRTIPVGRDSSPTEPQADAGPSSSIWIS